MPYVILDDTAGTDEEVFEKLRAKGLPYYDLTRGHPLYITIAGLFIDYLNISIPERYIYSTVDIWIQVVDKTWHCVKRSDEEQYRYKRDLYRCVDKLRAIDKIINEEDEEGT
jgi:hypothetical protein